MILLELIRIHLLFQFRNRQILLATIFFAVFLIFLFTLGFPKIDEQQATFYSGIFWISSFFSGNLILTNQTQLQANKFQQGLILTGIDPVNLFAAKLISSLIYMIFIQLVLIISMSMFFPFPANISIFNMLLYAILGGIGYLSIGTLFFSLIEFQNIKDLLITILFYPLVIPLFIYLHRGTSMILGGQAPNVLDFIIGYDLIFVFLSGLLYEFVIEDNV
ncbi:MAG: heme exporter protein CcmB [Proteobacteria bacterium]|nr:heme exporter protein CcmB [Pseudomonadota bacterium]